MYINTFYISRHQEQRPPKARDFGVLHCQRKLNLYQGWQMQGHTSCSVKSLVVDSFLCKYTTGYFCWSMKLWTSKWMKIIHKPSMMQTSHKKNAWSLFVMPLGGSSSVKTPFSSRKASAMNNFSRSRCCSSALSKALSNDGWWWNIASL